jgi:hypothetical protein
VALHRRTATVHLWVLLTFRGPKPSPLHEGRHLDGVKTNCRLDNLEWGTHQENIDDRTRHGTTARGERQWCAKLDAEKVKAMRALRAGGMDFTSIGRRFDVQRNTAKKACERKTWSHVL